MSVDPPERLARLHPTALLLHPVTLAALAVMILNDGWWRSRWPGVVTGKLSDVAALIAFPGVLAALWGAAVALVVAGLRALGRASRPAAGLGPVGLVVSVILPALILVGINLSPGLRDAYLGVLVAVDVVGWGPFHYTLDATDLWALPASAVPLLLGWRLLAGCRAPAGDL